MDFFEHNDNFIHYYIDYNFNKPRGKNKTVILFFNGYLHREDSLQIPIVGFDKDFETEDAILKFLYDRIGTIEKWIAIPKKHSRVNWFD